MNLEQILAELVVCLKACGRDVHKHVFSDMPLLRMFGGLQPFS